MPLVSCPQCRAELDLEAGDVGARVECPACLMQFTAATTEAVVPQLAPVLAISPPPAVVPKPAVDDSTASEVVITCQVCQGPVSVFKSDLGHQVECPLCNQQFKALAPKPQRPSPDEDRPPRKRNTRYEDDDRPRRYRYRDEEPVELTPKRMLRNARLDLASPGGAIQVLGWIDIVCGFISIIIGIAFLIAYLSNPGTGPGAGLGPMVWLNLPPGLTSVVLGGLKAFGGKAMKEVKHRQLAMWGAIASLVPANVALCLGVFMFPAYFVSLVFGIMALVQLSKAESRKAFEFNRPDGDVDAE